MSSEGRVSVEWRTVLLIAGTYLIWGIATAGIVTPWLAYPLIALTASFHASLTHEVCHGHPTRHRWLNDLMIAPALSLLVPHDRYRATHLAHHDDPTLTDPYDDPESNFYDPAVWNRLGPVARLVLRFNNTLFGRMLIGPLISTIAFYRTDLRLMLGGDASVRLAWAKHIPALGVVVLWLALLGQVSILGFLAATYAGLSVQKVRSYLEHRAHMQPRGRTVVVDRGGLLGFLFLNNHLHAVHHAHPGLAWYQLPAKYRARRAGFLARNHGYVYSGYGEIFRRYLLKPKDPVPHPLWPGSEDVPHEAPAPTSQPADVPLKVTAG